MTMKSVSLPAAAILGALALSAGAAQAGECPAGKQLATPRAIEDMPDRGVEREILSMVHLKGVHGVGDLFLRTRWLIVADAHAERPRHSHGLAGRWPCLLAC